jgi:hypothetical protein
MSNPVIIALSGWKRSGKDTVADYLVKTHGFKRLAFADPLKESVAKEFGLTRQVIDDSTTKEAPLLHMPVAPKDAFSLTIAEFMFKEFRSADGVQPVNLVKISGTILGEMPGNRIPEVLYWTPRALCILKGSSMRSADSDYWVKQALAQAQPGGLYVISDARYKNEMNVLKRFGGDSVTSVRINRFDSSPSTDPSERDLDDYEFDFVLENRTSIDDLYSRIDGLLRIQAGVFG